MIFSIVLAATAVYCIFNGIKTILTGTLSSKEEAQLKGFSEKGALWRNKKPSETHLCSV